MGRSLPDLCLKMTAPCYLGRRRELLLSARGLCAAVRLRWHPGDARVAVTEHLQLARPLPKEVEGTIGALEGAVTTLTAKAPDELGAYRELVLDVANAVAEAKGGVQEEETAVIERITAALATA